MVATCSGRSVLLVTALAAFAVGCVGVLAVVRRERPTYARLPRDLRDRSTFTVDADELIEFETRLERADRVRVRRPMAALALRILGILLAGAAALFLIALRASVVHRSRVEAVIEAQRAEVVAMLERARIPQRGSVPGLRDRVTRALAILREKQRSGPIDCDACPRRLLKATPRR